MPKINIRAANHNDIPILLQFEQGVIEAERPFDPTIKRTATNYYSIEEMIDVPHIQLLVAEQDEKIVSCGYARIEKAKDFLQHTRHAYLGFMYVLPEFRGQGINQLIIGELKKWALLKGVTEMRLEVYFQNEAAIRAYEKVGFTKHMIEMRIALNEPR